MRNLLEGRRVAAAIGRVLAVAYTPDSFGHPAQLPQLFAGFGLGPFVYWRGNGDEIDALGPDVPLGRARRQRRARVPPRRDGYFAAAACRDDTDAAVARPRSACVDRLGARRATGRCC